MQTGDRVCVLGFNSVDYTTIDMALGQIGAVSVPLQTSAAIAQLQPIVTETEPALIAASVNQLTDAVELIRGAAQAPAKLVVFDYHPQVDDEREAFDGAVAALWRVPAWRSRRCPTSCSAAPMRRRNRTRNWPKTHWPC